MKMNYSESETILRNFPKIELSYEKKSHKKVPSYNISLTIPKGKKYFAWFRYFKKKPVCFFLELDKFKKKIQDISIKRCCFKSELCAQLGTIVYGTIFMKDNMSFFNIEDIFYFKNIDVRFFNQFKKIKKIIELFKYDILQVAYLSNEIIFGLPIIDKKRETLLEKTKDISYPLYCIQHRLLHKTSPFINEFISIKLNLNKTFLIKANVEDDIYDLYYKNAKNELEKYTSAIIPDYKTSVWMNSLFRNIKENNNLDALEESDDEDEFENILDDKFVNMEKEYKILCVYLSKFNSWKPEKLSENDDICCKKDIEKYNNY